MNSIIEKLRKFAEVRDWEKFHTVKNLIMALASESGELCHAVRWSDTITPEIEDAIRAELADVLIFALHIYEKLHCTEKDILDDLNLKIYLNGLKYPASCSEKELTKLNNGV